MSRFAFAACRAVLVSCALAAALIGCSHTMVMSQPPSPERIEKANRQARDHVALVFRHDGRTQKGRTVRFANDSVRVAAIETETVQLMRTTGFMLPPVETFSFANFDVARVRIVNRERGTREGAVAGLLIGLALGATTKTPLWEDAANFETAAFVYVVAGIILGAVAGSHIASPTNVRFAPAAGVTAPR